MRAVGLFFLIVFAISERVFYVGLGDYRIGLFDFSLIFFLLFHSLNNLKIGKSILILVLLVFISQVIQGLIYNSPISYTASLTVTLKILYVAAISRGLIKIVHMKIISIVLFIIFSFFLLFLSDGSPIYQTEFFNRNETISYLLALVFLMPERYNKLRWTMLLALILFSLIVHSRQILLSFIIGLFLLVFFTTRVSFYNKIIILVFFPLVLVFGYKIYFNGLDEYDSRRYSILDNVNFLEVDDVESNAAITQGDKFRILNIAYGLNGWKSNPILGNGLGSYVRLNEFGKVAHNTYVTLLFEGGLMFLLLFYYTLRRAIVKNLSFLTYLLLFVVLINLNFIEAIGKFTIYMIFIGLAQHRRFLLAYDS